MKNILFFLVLITIISCKQDKQPLLGDTEWQREMNASFKDVTKSPLKDKDRKTFEGLNFFTFDSTYIVTATFISTPEEKSFKMKTSTNRLPEYIKYGELNFELHGETLKLNIYQSLELEDEKNNLFLSFLDNTNGDTSYGGGRYIDLKTLEDTIIIDFNKAYNPYCAYNEKYSCPIVPRENYLPIEVKAGVKAFEKD
jgi:hypothetical protein